jgi:glycosyltransferase involved in cell wall biosynthesis
MQGGKDWIGGTEYIKNIVFALASLPDEVRSTFELCLLCSNSVESSLYNQINSDLDRIYYLELDLQPVTVLNRIIWKFQRSFFKENNARLDDFFRREKIDFVYPYFTESTRKPAYQSAAWIYDFQHKYLPEFFTKEEIQIRDRLFASIAGHSSTVVLSSKTAEADFHKFYPEAATKTQVLSFKTYPNSSWYNFDPRQTQKQYCLPDRFFIVSNQFWQHKNHLVIFKALKILQSKSIYPMVVCTGSIYDFRQPDYSNTILQTIHTLGIAQQIYLLGLIPRLDQIQLMRCSLAVIQPSLFEGWSTVVEDARCLGKLMILSDLPVHLEQNPPNSVFFERYSADSLAAILGDWWEQRSPGIDIEQEAIAKENNLKEVQKFGQQFLKIVKRG